MKIPDGYHPRNNGLVTTTYPPNRQACDVCGNKVYFQIGFERRGHPDISVCDACMKEYLERYNENTD